MKKRFFTIIVSALFAICGINAYCYKNQEFCQKDNSNTSQPSFQIKIKNIKTCDLCEGSGKMTIKKTHAACQGKGCVNCDYKGYTETKVTCAKCKGSGKIETVIK